MSTEPITFLDKNYTQADLENASTEDLLTLRNLVASNLGVASVKQFKDHSTAVSQTWKALMKYDKETAAPTQKAKAKAKSKEPKEYKLAKPAMAQHVKRPTRRMFATMQVVKPFDGEEDRGRRSTNYADGMMIIDAIEGEGTMRWDIDNWAKQGYVKIVEATDAEYVERRAAWYKKHDREDPDLTKQRQIEERAAAKAKREEERAAKKAEREAAKEAKAQERAAAKAKKEAEKASEWRGVQ